MADMMASLGLSDKDFKRGLTSAAAAAGSIGAKIKQRLGEAGGELAKKSLGTKNVGMAAFGGITAAIGIATKAYRDYADVSRNAESQMRDLGAVGSKAWRDIGANVESVMPYLIEAARWAGELYDKITRAAAITFHGEDAVNEADAAKAESRAQDVKEGVAEYRRQLELKASAERDGALTAKRIQIDEDRRRALEDISKRKSGEWAGGDTAEVQKAIDAVNFLHRTRMSALEQERRAKDHEAKLDATRRANDAREERAKADEEKRRQNEERAREEKEAAERAQREKADALKSLNDRRSNSTLGGGMAGVAGLTRLAFGADDNQKKQLKTLEKIAQLLANNQQRREAMVFQ